MFPLRSPHILHGPTQILIVFQHDCGEICQLLIAQQGNSPLFKAAHAIHKRARIRFSLLGQREGLLTAHPVFRAEFEKAVLSHAGDHVIHGLTRQKIAVTYLFLCTEFLFTDDIEYQLFIVAYAVCVRPLGVYSAELDDRPVNVVEQGKRLLSISITFKS